MNNNRHFSIFVASVLLVAGSLKLSELVTEVNLFGAVSYPDALVRVSLVLLEFMIGITILSNAASRAIWWFATAFFLVLGLYSLYSWWNGGLSCGCFGKVLVGPLQVALFDFCLAFGCLWFGVGLVSTGGELSSNWFSKSARRTLAVFAAILIALFCREWSGVARAFGAPALVGITEMRSAEYEGWLEGEVILSSRVRNRTVALHGYKKHCGVRVLEDVFPVRLDPGRTVRVPIQIRATGAERTVSLNVYSGEDYLDDVAVVCRIYLDKKDGV